MESFVQFRRGDTPHHVHRDLNGLKDEELGRNGFTGRQAQLYRLNDPTLYRAQGPISMTDVLAEEVESPDLEDPEGLPVPVFSNDDVRFLLSRRSVTAPFIQRNVGGDELIFVHRGAGVFHTEFGTIPYEQGDWVLIPKAVTYQQVPDPVEHMLWIIESVAEFRVPQAGVLGRHHPFDPTTVFVPQPEVRTDGGPTWRVRIIQRELTGEITYDHNPFDVKGWKGDYFPFKLNIRDYNPIMSEMVHLPPTAQLFMQSDGVVVTNLLPRPAESREGAERLPSFHRNADYDEVLLFHSGDLLGVAMPPGLISHVPQGLHHGPPERARERARRKFADYDRVNWSVIAVDTRRPLVVNPDVRRTSQEAK